MMSAISIASTRAFSGSARQRIFVRTINCVKVNVSTSTSTTGWSDFPLYHNIVLSHALELQSVIQSDRRLITLDEER